YKLMHHPSKTLPVPVVASAPVTPITGQGSVASRPEMASRQEALNPFLPVQRQLDALQTGLTAALNKRQIMLEDLDKLSFDTPNAKENPEYNVFNPKG